MNTKIKIGKPAPDITLINQDSKEVSIQDLKGSWVVLYFYPKDNTPGCTTEAVDFSRRENDFKKLNAVVIGISPDSVSKHCKFIEKNELTISLLSDIDKIAVEKYGVWQIKKMYGRESMGVVRSTFLINPDGIVIYVWDKVRVKGHVDDVFEKLKEFTG